MEKVRLKMRTRAPVHLGMRTPGAVRLKIDKSSGAPIVWYEGPYEVTPTRSEQLLACHAKTMRHDVTVHEIPYYQTTNPYGKTYVIGE